MPKGSIESAAAPFTSTSCALVASQPPSQRPGSLERARSFVVERAARAEFRTGTPFCPPLDQLMLTPVGFPPQEISAMINRPVIAQHAEEVAFLWCQRQRAVADPRYSLADLAALDLRLSAHEEGLLVAGDVGWSECLDAVASNARGAYFALGTLAFAAGNRGRMSEALAAAGTSAASLSELASSLGWLELQRVVTWIRLLLEAAAPHHRLIGVSAAATHRHDPGKALIAAISDPDGELRARALRACGELRRRDLAEQVRLKLDDDVPACRFWAAWALTLIGDARDALSVLWQFVEAAHPLAMRALETSLRSIPAKQARQRVSLLARRGGSDRLVVVAAGVVGDPESVPWLLERMEVPELARLAGDSFAAITGVDLAYADLVSGAVHPEVDSTEEGPIPGDYESNLDWPSAPLVAQWWNLHKRSFVRGERYLDGKSIDVGGAVHVLTRGRQPRRAAAVLELARLAPDWIPMEVGAKGSRQFEEIARWTS
jgi:uncharacterized protein (TIGR02270 family)